MSRGGSKQGAGQQLTHGAKAQHKSLGSDLINQALSTIAPHLEGACIYLNQGYWHYEVPKQTHGLSHLAASCDPVHVM